MKLLPLYAEVPKGPLSSAVPRSPSPDCKACGFHAKADTVALRPEGSIGGTFFVADAPDARSGETHRGSIPTALSR